MDNLQSILSKIDRIKGLVMKEREVRNARSLIPQQDPPITRINGTSMTFASATRRVYTPPLLEISTSDEETKPLQLENDSSTESSIEERDEDFYTETSDSLDITLSEEEEVEGQGNEQNEEVQSLDDLYPMSDVHSAPDALHSPLTQDTDLVQQRVDEQSIISDDEDLDMDIDEILKKFNIDLEDGDND